VSPSPGADAADGFELSLAGSADAVQGAAPWLQRFLATTLAGPGAPGPLPEILQESRRISLRCQLSRDQLDAAMARLNQPPLPQALASEGRGAK